MEGERKRSKGGFFQLFDWNGKSRKKLFSNNSPLHEGSKQEKENDENMAKPRQRVTEMDDRRSNSSNKGGSDFSCASSVTSEEGYGTRAPGVVARLMGLDSLPTSSTGEPSCSPSFDYCSLGPSHYDRSVPNLWGEKNPMEQLNIPNKLERYSLNYVESRLQKVQNHPIERFQTEMLPPKSAKSIPITHHKLLSPIKSPGFIPTKNVAYIMDAAARIINASPKATTINKVPSIGSSSVPLRIRDLKQKMEAAHTASRPQRSSGPCVGNNVKEQHTDWSKSASEGQILRNKGKLVSLAAHAKVSVQRREGSMSRGSNITKQNEQNGFKSNRSVKSQLVTQKPAQKITSNNGTNNVLRQNNQKQNCVPSKDISASKNSDSVQQGRKNKPPSGSVGSSMNANKVKQQPLSRKMGLATSDSEKEKPKVVSRRKQSVKSNLQIDRTVSDNTLHNKDGKSIKCNVEIDGMNAATSNRKNGMDVVSFTFTSPIARPTISPQSSGMSNSSVTDSCDSSSRPCSKNLLSSFVGLNVISGDALGVLLEQKLRELTDKVESSYCNNISREGNPASLLCELQNSVPAVNVATATPAVEEQELLHVQDNDKPDHPDDFDCSSVEDSRTVNQMWQHSEEMEEHSSCSNYNESAKEVECQHHSPVSMLEPSFSSGSCSKTNGYRHHPPAQAEISVSAVSTNETSEIQGYMDLSVSASLMSTMEAGRNHKTGKSKESNDWELDYLRDILNNAEIMLHDFSLNQTPYVMTPNLFDQLENQETRTERSQEEHAKLMRKVFFDCINECLDYKRVQIFGGSCKSWAKMSALFEREALLAKELYKEILGWKSMGDLMVDELVDKDMSTKHGKWLDFNIETFEECVEIENGILTTLVDELVSDMSLM